MAREIKIKTIKASDIKAGDRLVTPRGYIEDVVEVFQDGHEVVVCVKAFDREYTLDAFDDAEIVA